MQEFTSAAEMRAHYKAVHARFWPPPQPKRFHGPEGQRSAPAAREKLPTAGAAPPPPPPEPPPAPPPPPPYEPPEALIWNCRAAWDRQGTTDRIIWACCTYYDIAIGDMRSGMRTPQVVRARQVAIYLMHTILPRKTSSVIARAFHRDHSTALYAVQVVSKRIMSGDEELERELRFLYRTVLGDERDRVQFDELCSV